MLVAGAFRRVIKSRVVFDEHELLAFPAGDVLERNAASGIGAVTPDGAVTSDGIVPPEHAKARDLPIGLLTRSNPGTSLSPLPYSYLPQSHLRKARF